MTNQDNLWTVPKLWPDSTVFLVGGGPSLNTTGLVWSNKTKDTINSANIIGLFIKIPPNSISIVLSII